MSLNITFRENEGKRNYHSCPMCFSTEIEKVMLAQDYTVSQESFEVWKCRNCSGRFTQKIPVENQIGSYYQSEDYISHSDTNKGLINRLYQMVRNYTLAQKRTLVQKVSGKDKGFILDIGCGTGDFLGTMKNVGWDCLGLEPDEGARKIAKEKHGLNVQETSQLFELAEDSRDVISMWHVLEHVHELHAYLEKIRKLLKQDGTLIIAVPNFESLDASHYGKVWAAYDVPRHLYHFSPASMDELMGKHGFEVFQMKPMPFDSFYVSLLSEKYKHGKMKLVPGFWTGFRSFLSATGSPQKCSSVLYLIRKK